jgi:type I restriction enzyme S subunit
LKDIAPLQRGFDLPATQLRPGPYPVVYSNGVLNYHSHAMVNGPGVVTGRSGTIGKVHFVPSDFWPHNTALWVTAFKGNDPRFIYYLYSFLDFARFLSGTGVPTLNRNNVHTQFAALPPADEQRAIADSLSDVDASIDALDRLIEKKRAMKLGAMQQLLAGRIRLPGFSEPWEAKRIGEIFSIQLGRSLSRYVRAGGTFVVVDMGSVSKDGQLLTTKSTDFAGDLLQAGDLVMPKDDIGGGNIIGKVAVIDARNRYVLGDHIYALRAKEGHSPFLAYAINGHAVNRSLRNKAVGSAQLGLGRRSVEEQVIPFPPTREQEAIAAILSVMDAAIEVLTGRREKTKDIKRGMMQALLTGRVRLRKDKVTP